MIPKGEIGVEGGITFNDRKEGESRFGFQPQIIYGAFENTQIEIMTSLVTEPSTWSGDDKSGDLSVAALYNCTTESINVPALAARVGEDSKQGSAVVNPKCTAHQTGS